MRRGGERYIIGWGDVIRTSSGGERLHHWGERLHHRVGGHSGTKGAPNFH